MTNERSIQRTSQGVPRYDGTPELFPLYKEEALQFLMTFVVSEAILGRSRLASELKRTARMAIRTMTLRDPQWISHPIEERLESVVSKPSLVGGSRYIIKFFYNLQRKKQETMTSWIARHSEALWEAEPGPCERSRTSTAPQGRRESVFMGDRFKPRQLWMGQRV